MAEMTKQDWDLKDRRIVKQSMLKAAVEFHARQLENGAITSVEGILSTANKFVDWVYDESQKEIAKCDNIPTPTQDQAKALKLVEEKTRWTKEQVFAKFSKYPDMSNVEACIKKIKENQ